MSSPSIRKIRVLFFEQVHIIRGKKKCTSRFSQIHCLEKKVCKSVVYKAVLGLFSTHFLIFGCFITQWKWSFKHLLSPNISFSPCFNTRSSNRAAKAISAQVVWKIEIFKSIQLFYDTNYIYYKYTLKSTSLPTKYFPPFDFSNFSIIIKKFGRTSALKLLGFPCLSGIYARNASVTQSTIISACAFSKLDFPSNLHSKIPKRKLLSI